ncbi:MAG: substrate-binding domain-containing protein [Pseudomonadota bacterium]
MPLPHIDRSPTMRAAWLAVLCLAMWAGAATAAVETVTLGGAGAGLSTMRALAAEFAKVAPDVSIVILPSMGSGGGMRALSAKVVDMAVVSRPASPQEAARGLVAVEYGRTPFVFVTSKDDVHGFDNVAQAAEIISGRRHAWPDGTPIRVVMQNKRDGNTVQLEKISLAMNQAVQTALAKPGAIIASYGEAAAETIERTPGAFGTSNMALVLTGHRHLNMLSIQGIAPSPKAIADGSYPYYKTMFVAHGAAVSPATRRFIAFIFSAKGRQVLLRSGHWLPGQPAQG